MSLFRSAKLPDWETSLARYEAGLTARGALRLATLDDWYRRDLPALLASRPAPYVTRDELARVTEWKMKRGVYRARNSILVGSNTEDEVRACSGKAFAAIPDLRRPLAALAELRGVGPATASAVLAAARPDLYPFFDELIAAQIPGLGVVAFTLRYYLRYAVALRARADALGSSWTAHAVGQALWAHAST